MKIFRNILLALGVVAVTSCNDDPIDISCPEEHRYIGIFAFDSVGTIYLPICFRYSEDRIIAVDNSSEFNSVADNFNLRILDEFYSEFDGQFVERGTIVTTGEYRDTVVFGGCREFLINGRFRCPISEGTIEYLFENDTLTEIKKSNSTIEYGDFIIQPKEFLIDKYPEVENL